MKAITYRRYGPPEVLGIEEVDKPVAKDDEILIRVRAVEATKSDVEMRRFRFAVKWFWLPMRIAFGVTKTQAPHSGRLLLGRGRVSRQAGDRLQPRTAGLRRRRSSTGCLWRICRAAGDVSHRRQTRQHEPRASRRGAAGRLQCAAFHAPGCDSSG